MAKRFSGVLGTGEGSSALEVIRTFEAVSGKTIPYEIGERRTGGVAVWRLAFRRRPLLGQPRPEVTPGIMPRMGDVEMEPNI